MTVEEIPADELVIMTEFWHRAFNAAGCDPMCHCCEKMLPISSNFKLATIFIAPKKWGQAAYFQKQVLLGKMTATFEDYKKFWKEEPRRDFFDSDVKKMTAYAKEYELAPKEVMLCENCTPEVFMLRELKYLKKEIKRIKAPKGGCFRVNGKIIH